jgi:multidrug efflux pump subunit AcrB
MSRFSVRNPYFVVVACLIIAVVGAVSLVRMPVDLFPQIDIPVVVVATFYSGMPPGEIETSITARYERFFTLASNIDHIESRSLTGASLIKIHFRPGTNADAAVSAISSLAMANLRRLPPGTLPPIVLKFDASSLPVCLVTLKGEGLDETALRDLALYNIRNQIATVPGASAPQPFGGKTRQIMVYVDPAKLAAYQMSPMDVVRAVNESNVVLPSGELRLGTRNYSLGINNLADAITEVDDLPLKTAAGATVHVRDVGQARDAQAIQMNVVRIDGQRSVYLPVLKQGGDSNTIAVVDGTRAAASHLVDIPPSLEAKVVFDQSEFVKKAIRNLLQEGGLGLILTALMILIFLGSLRATTAVLLSIPLSALATFVVLAASGSSVNTMILGGLALAFSRLIDNSVVVLENIVRHLEMGKVPELAAIEGGREVALPVLAATLTTAVVFFPVTFLVGVSKYLFSALALAVVLSLLASYVVAMTVVPLFAARFLKAHTPEGTAQHGSFLKAFDRGFTAFTNFYGRHVHQALLSPWRTAVLCLLIPGLGLLAWPWLQFAFFPRIDSGQILANIKAPSGTRLEAMEEATARLEQLIRSEIPEHEIDAVVSNLGVNQDFSALYTTNSGQDSGFLQVSLKDGHATPTDDLLPRLRRRIAAEMPELSVFLLQGGLVDAILSQGQPTPIDLQVSGSNLRAIHELAESLAAKIRAIPGVAQVFIPQDIDSPLLTLSVDRARAGLLGLTQREVASNVITGLNSNQQITPGYWIDRKTGYDYLLTVQFPENTVNSLGALENLPLHGSNRMEPTRLGAVATIGRDVMPTEITRYQLRRVVDVHVALDGEDQGRVASEIEQITGPLKLPRGVQISLRGMVQSMRASFESFGYGLILSLVLLYLILVAQFRSFVDPLLILLAVPPGLAGVVVTLALSGTSLNIMSLMGVIMMTGIVVSNSILIVEFAHRLREESSLDALTAVAMAARIRLRPVLMTSLATIFGLLPMALKLGEGSESYAPLARAILGGLLVSLLFTLFLVPSGFVLVHGRKTA